MDGNHRYAACSELGMPNHKIPYVVKENVQNPIREALQSNWDEETSRPMTFLDYAFLVCKQHNAGQTYENIGKTLGWSETKTIFYNDIATKLNPAAIELIKKSILTQTSENISNDENECVSRILTNVNFWNPSWFRDITPLNEENQLFVIEEIIKRNGELKGQKLKQLCQRLKLHEEMIVFVEENLLNKEHKTSLIEDIKKNVYDKLEQIQRKVEQLNQESKKQLIHGDTRVELEKIDDNYIDVVITDPPYGENFISSRRKIDFENINTAIISDKTREQANNLLQQTLSILIKKMKNDSLIFIFCNWRSYPDFKQVVEKYFEMKNLLIWDKCHQGMGDLKHGFGNQYEMIIFAKKGNKKLRAGVSSNILPFKRIHSSHLGHPMEKPIDLLEFLIEKSAGEGEVICDPFMGVGSTIVACGNRNPYVGIELDEKYFKIAQRKAKG